MNKVFNLPRKLTDKRRFYKDEKEVLAAWLGIKFSFGNSTLYDFSIKHLMQFYHIGFSKAKKLNMNIRKDDELFIVNDKKNCLFAKSCKDKVGHEPTKKHTHKYFADDVFTFDVPTCYTHKEKSKRSTLSLAELVRLIDEALVCKECDDNSGYKSKKGDPKVDNENCETHVKTQESIARKTGLSRIKVNRILNNLVKKGVLSKTEMHIERCNPGEPYSFKALNKKTRMWYYAKCVPVTFKKISDKVIKFRYIIWNNQKRLLSKFLASDKTIAKIIKKEYLNIKEKDMDFSIIAERQLKLREMYD